MSYVLLFYLLHFGLCLKVDRCESMVMVVYLSVSFSSNWAVTMAFAEYFAATAATAFRPSRCPPPPAGSTFYLMSVVAELIFLAHPSPRPSVSPPRSASSAALYSRVVDELADDAAVDDESSASKKGASLGHRTTSSQQRRAEARAKEGRELLGELLRMVAELLASGPVHREEFLQVCCRFGRVFVFPPVR